MSDYLTAFIGFFSETHHQSLILFFSAFLSATLLPGNSEIVFGTFVGQTLWANRPTLAIELATLLASATLGNSLGSLTTYYLARCIPVPAPHSLSPLQQKALLYAKRYGVWVLLLGWLPVFGDILCAVAGWLRLHLGWSLLCIMLGKLCRYLVILIGLSTWFG